MTAEQRHAAHRAWLDAICDPEMLPCHMQRFYRSIPRFHSARYFYRYVFQKYRRELEERIRAGKAQSPGSVYEPALDDGRGGLTAPAAWKNRLREAA